MGSITLGTQIFRTITLILVLAALLLGIGNSGQFIGHAQAIDSVGIGIQDFHVVSENHGWLLFGQRLFWTQNNGENWKDITPVGAQERPISDVFFLDEQHAWVGLADGGTPLSNFTLERTADGGNTWEEMQVNIPAGAYPISNMVRMQWLDSLTGWLMLKQLTGSSFSAGRLLQTLDGGATWIERTIPVGERPYFISRTRGWVVGPDGDALYRTLNSGLSWERNAVATTDNQTNAIFFYHSPAFDTEADGLMPVVRRNADQSQYIELYATHDGGDSWTLVNSVSIPAGITPLIELSDARHGLVALPGSQNIFRIDMQQDPNAFQNEDGGSANLTQIDMASASAGWAKAVSYNCVAQHGTKTVSDCVVDTQLLRTDDAGLTWSPIALPETGVTSFKESIQISGASLQSSSDLQSLSTQTVTGQGFDSCSPPSLSQMQDWKTNSPYGVWNLYIGGSNRGCKAANEAAITSTFVSQLYQQGWKFIPTWVGLQASCSNLSLYKMSNDPTTAYNQGVSEADSASDVLSSLGLGGTIIYFDLEAFSTADATCKAAAQSFISGWTARLHARGNQAAVYGSSCASWIDLYYLVSNVPDAIWPAAWGGYSYNSGASVWGVSCLSDNHWNNHQRIHQYAGGHNETWGSTTLNIDSDVLDGVVAIPGGGGGGNCPQSGGVILYWNANYECSNTMGDTGYRQRTGTGWQNVNDGQFNDKASSIRIPAGWSVRLFADANREGANICYSSTTGDFGMQGYFPTTSTLINDQVSSIDVFSDPYCGIPPGTRAVSSDFDRDGKSDPVKFDSSSFTASWLNSTTSIWSSLAMGNGS